MTTKRFPAITVYQPWASLIAGGFKHYETRHWQPPRSLVGNLIAIHAGKLWTQREKRWLAAYQQLYPEITSMAIPLGAIVAMCRLTAVLPTEALTNINQRERSFGDFSPGRFGWQLEVVRVPQNPIVVTGKQGIWYWEG